MLSERPGTTRGRTRGRVVAALILAGLMPATAAELEVRVIDPKGRPVAGAVVAAVPVEGSISSAEELPSLVIDQIDKEFVPYVTAVPVGTAISFPNHDDIRHHVYSFSPAKKFELPLYKGVPAEPVVFDQPGTVVLGCNIHDWMLAYVYVLATSHFGQTGEDGTVRIPALSAGNYDVRVEHPRAKKPPPPLRVEVDGDDPSPLTFELTLKPDFRRARAPRSGQRDY